MQLFAVCNLTLSSSNLAYEVSVWYCYATHSRQKYSICAYNISGSVARFTLPKVKKLMLGQSLPTDVTINHFYLHRFIKMK